MAKEYLSLSDIARRWGISRQYVQVLYKNDTNFPEPSMTVKRGLQPLFDLDEIKKYEPTKGYPKSGGE